MPVLAFVVLGALAGTSIYIGERGASGGGDGASVQDVEQPAPESAAPEDTSRDLSDTGGGSEMAGESAAGDAATAPQAGKATSEPLFGEDRSGAAGGAQSTGPTSGPGTSTTTISGSVGAPPDGAYVDEEGDRTCVATRDETQLTLPDGRLAQEILTAPFGIYVVCG